MTYYAGSKAASAEHGVAYGNPDIGFYPNTFDHNVGRLVPTLPTTSSQQSHQPDVQVGRVLRAGFKQEQFGFLDFYNRIHIQYRLLDLGNIVSTQTISFYVFNAYFEDRTLNEIVGVGTAGLTLTEPASTPLVYEPLQEYKYTLSVSPDGPPTVAATYTFDFDNRDYQLDITGTRLVLFYFEPDGGIVEELQWKTDIFTAYDGTEQRSALRSAPRQRLDYSVLTEGLQETKLQGMLFDWLPRVFGVPIWFELRRLNAEADAGDTVLDVSTSYADFRANGLVMIYEGEDKHEVIGISSYDSTSITLDAELANSYSRKAVVMPVRVAYASTQVTRNIYPTGLAKTSVSFTTIENQNLASTSGSTIYEGRVLLDDANFMGETLAQGFEREVTVVDSGSGQIYQTSGWDRSKTSTRKQWRTFNSQADVWRIRQLLHSFDGSRKGFWLPSFRADLELAQTIGGNTSTMRIKLCGYTQFYRSRRPYGNIRLVLKNGTKYTRLIEDSNVDGSEEVLTIDAPFRATPILVSEVERIEFVGLMRIANDKAKLTHTRAGTAQIEIQVSSVKLPSVS
jgi:hypothetical protein